MKAVKEHGRFKQETILRKAPVHSVQRLMVGVKRTGQ